MMSISEAARRAGLSAYTIRYYEDAGVISAPARLRSGHRDYSDQDVRILACVAALRRAGMPVKAMKSFLSELRAAQGAAASDAIAPEVIERCVRILEAHRAQLAADLNEIGGLLEMTEATLASVRRAKCVSASSALTGDSECVSDAPPLHRGV